jgi:murein L,D-transpeptidase YcbB/YkuD
VSVAPTITSVAGGASTYDISIESGAVTTATTSVTLSLYGTGAYTMELSNRSDFSGATWIPYATTMPWTLASSTGEQTVYAQFKSVSGIIIGSAQASIDFVSASSSSTVSPPSQSSTTTIASLTAELANLESQLAALQAEANGTTTTNHQFVFTRNLHLGMTGADVNALQLFLIAKNSGPAAQKLAAHGTTTYFGALTQNALIEFQKKVGIKPAIGYFGAITRAWVNAAY